MGSTIDLKRRVEEHLRGVVPATQYRLPVRLVCYEACRAFRHRPDGRNDPRSLPDYDTEPVMAFLRHLKRPAAPECASRTPCSAGRTLRRQLFRVAGAPRNPKSPCLTFGPTFVTLRPWKRTLSASDSRPTHRTAKSDFLSVRGDCRSVKVEGF